MGSSGQHSNRLQNRLWASKSEAGGVTVQRAGLVSRARVLYYIYGLPITPTDYPNTCGFLVGAMLAISPQYRQLAHRLTSISN